MIRKPVNIIFMVLVVLVAGCVKETYDMNRLSKKIHLSPVVALSAIKGDVSLSDAVTPGDTVVFDETNFVKVIFREDSLLDLKMADFYDLNDMVSFNQSYTVGELNIDPFYETLTFTLNQISSFFTAPLRAQFVALDNTTNNFPAFPSTDLGESTFPTLTGFENAVFASGSIEISLLNNLTAPLNGVNIQLYNTSGHTPVGNPATITLIQPGEMGLTSVDLTDETLTNSITAEIVLTGSPGTTSPVYIDLDGSNIVAGIHGKDLKVKSGRVILPLQYIESLDHKDTITVDPGTDIEIDEFKINTGTLSYHISSTSPAQASVNITLPTALKSGVSVNESVNVGPYANLDGSILMDNTMIDLGTDPTLPYNRVPMEYSIEISSGNTIVDFDSQDEISLDFEMLDPDFDYVKGYFGQQVEAIDPDSIDLELEDVLSKISGDFLVSSPSIKLNYSNSFAIPMEISLDARGTRENETVDLGLAPVILYYPEAPGTRDISASFVIDKNNSSLPELISMPPGKIRFSGSAKMNPEGNSGLRDNYVFGDSRFIGSLEIEVPMEFRMNNLQFTDTVDNFLQDDNGSDDNSVKPEDFELLRIDLKVKNGFPLGVSLKISLYDSLTQVIRSTVEATDLISPAIVDSNGKVTEARETETSIEFTKEFFSSVDDADKIIFQFTLNTTDNGSRDVKIYSDYRIDFHAALVLKPDMNFNLK